MEKYQFTPLSNSYQNFFVVYQLVFMKILSMNNEETTIMGLFNAPYRINNQAEKSLRVMQSLQLQHDRFFCNYSDLSISAIINKR